MQYTRRLESDLEALERAAMAVANAEGDARATLRRDYIANIDHVANTYPIPAGAVRRHAERVRRITENNPEGTASKRIATQHEVFLAEICDDYDPVY